jgi:carboxymethylenebutenolidase
LAKLGYLAIAPELYARQGDVSGLKEHGEILQVVAKVPDAQVMADLDATAAWATREGGDVDKLAITGFCWGGRIAWLYAARNLRLKAGIAWYGGLVRPVTPNTPVHPIDIAASLKVPVLGLYGGADSGIPVDSVEKMRAALGTGDSGSEIVLYADTPHGFHADYRPSYRPQQAGDGWTRMIAWLRQHGVA